MGFASDDGHGGVDDARGFPSHRALAPRQRIEALVRATLMKVSAQPQVTPCEAYRMQKEAQQHGGGGGRGGGTVVLVQH